HLLHIGFEWIGFFKPQFLYEGLLDDLHISVFAKNQWDDYPIIGCADLAISSMVAFKGSAPPSLHMGCLPRGNLSLPGIFCRFMGDILCGQRLSFGNVMQGFSYDNPIHVDFLILL